MNFKGQKLSIGIYGLRGKCHEAFNFLKSALQGGTSISQLLKVPIKTFLILREKWAPEVGVLHQLKANYLSELQMKSAFQ